MAAHVRATPPVPRDLVPSLPDKLEFLILRALAKQPGARPQTMAALAAELSAIDPASAGGSTLIRDTGEADADTVGPNKTSLLPTGGGPGKTTLSAATMETADHAGAAGRPARSRGTMVFVMGAAVVASAGAIVWIAGHQTTDRAEISRAEPRATVAQPLPTAQPQPAHEPSPLSAPAPMLALETVIAANPAPAPAARSAFPKAAESVAGRRPASLSKISIDSVPPGARVCWVGSAKLLGKTPLEIDLAEVGSRARLLLEHAGYRSQEVKLPVGGPVALRKLGPDDFEDVSLCGTEK
jgi:serine/threonine-protein kinase